MGIDVNKIHIPINFELFEETKDDRFQKVKIWIAHTGENLNNTYFSKELLEEMASTLPYIPIVGFVEKNKDDDNDFSDHRSVLVIDKDKIEMEYQGNAYGFIPEQPNAQIEYRAGKEWLTAEGYLWTKFTKSMDIFDKSGGVKSQSMEIQNVEGEVDELGRLVFSQGRFSALCILGEHVPPAMTGSTVEFYSIVQNSIKEMMHEFSLQKGDYALNEEESVETVETQDEELVEETIEEVVEEVETEVESDSEQSGEETEATESNEEDTTEENSDETEDDVADEAEFSHIAEFELSHNDIRKNLNNLVRSIYAEEPKSAYVLEIYEERLIASVYNYETDKEEYFEISYSKDGDTLSLGEMKEVVSMFITLDEAQKIKDTRSQVEALESQLAELQAYKAKQETSDKEAILEAYSEMLSEEEKEVIRAEFNISSIEDIEKEVAFACFKKNKTEIFSSGVNAIPFNGGKGNDQVRNRYGSLVEYFN